jgi:hypothetical protein
MSVAFLARSTYNEIRAQKSSGNVSLGEGQFDLPLARGVRGLVGLGPMGYIYVSSGAGGRIKLDPCRLMLQWYDG